MTLNLKKGSKAYTPAFQAGVFTSKLTQGSAVLVVVSTCLGFPGGSEGKVSACNVGDPGSIPQSGRFPGEGNGNPLQYSCLENPMDGGAWWATVHGVAKSQMRLSDFTFFLSTCFILSGPKSL
ncbi:unnamed protein product [Rangifer tarandus platyrhynchus]|uniref:Fibrinogen C-terminal domain-containing protein n=2 Tax=Rangifer tarandus platyrhynchus TaxID=3082113 RepID=A0ABN8Z033_RANTA|nr:unnamed protein product [Rangifer tarandus platyrhynchus]